MTAAQQLEIVMFVAGIIAGTFGYAFASRYTIAREKYRHSRGYASSVQRRFTGKDPHFVRICLKGPQQTEWRPLYPIPNGSLVEVRDGIATFNGLRVPTQTRFDWRIGHAE